LDAKDVIKILEAIEVMDAQILKGVDELRGFSQTLDTWLAKRFGVNRFYARDFLKELAETPEKYRAEQAPLLRKSLQGD